MWIMRSQKFSQKLGETVKQRARGLAVGFMFRSFRVSHCERWCSTAAKWKYLYGIYTPCISKYSTSSLPVLLSLCSCWGWGSRSGRSETPALLGLRLCGHGTHRAQHQPPPFICAQIGLFFSPRLFLFTFRYTKLLLIWSPCALVPWERALLENTGQFIAPESNRAYHAK